MEAGLWRKCTLATVALTVVVFVSLACNGSESPTQDRAQIGDLTITDHSHRRDGIGNLIITGEIENTGGDVWTYVKVSASGYDADGDLVDTGWTYADMTRIRPGDVSPFTIYIDEEERGIVQYKVKIIGGESE